MSQELIYRFKQISLLLMDIQSNNDDDKKIQNTFFALFIVCIVIILPLTATVIVMTLKSQEWDIIWNITNYFFDWFEWIR